MKECSISFIDVMETIGEDYDKSIEKIDILDPQFDWNLED